MNRFRDYIVRSYRQLLQMHDTPHAIAGGVAIGVFFGFTPLFGVRILMAVLMAWIFRCSKAAAAIAANLHEIFLFFWGVVYIYEFKLGYWLLSSPHRLPPKIPRHVRLSDVNWQHVHDVWFNWDVFVRTGWPWLVGSVITGLPFAVLFFFLTLELVQRQQAKRSGM